MHATQPATTTLRLKEFWVPRVNTHVEVMWTSPEGVKCGNLRGQWFKGKVVNLEWPPGSGIPGAWIKYEDGSVHWHGMDLFDTTIKPRNAHKRDHTHTWPVAATEWLGVGSRVSVRWPAAGWHRGKVIGSDRHGVIVGYGDGSAVAHDNLHRCGCRIHEFRRDMDQVRYYRERPELGCPYKGDEEDCECEPCRTGKWPGWLQSLGLTSAQRRDIMEADPWDRRERVVSILAPESNAISQELGVTHSDLRKGARKRGQEVAKLTHCPECESPICTRGGSLSCTCQRCWCEECAQCKERECKCECNPRARTAVLTVAPVQEWTSAGSSEQCAAKDRAPARGGEELARERGGARENGTDQGGQDEGEGPAEQLEGTVNQGEGTRGGEAERTSPPVGSEGEGGGPEAEGQARGESEAERKPDR